MSSTEPSRPAPRAASEGSPTALAKLLAPPAAALLAVLLAWWALAEGAYFPTVALPGLIVLCASVAIAVIGAGRAPELRRRVAIPGVLAAAALIALALWSALSALWSPSPDVALTDGFDIAGYALALILGGCVAAGSGGRRELALVPLAVAALLAGAVTVARMMGGDGPGAILDIDGTLQAPLGYRNATAAFFLLGFLASVGIAASRPVDWRLRGLAGASASLCAAMGVVCQSRASLPAFAIAVLVLLLASPLKLRALSWTLLTFLPGLIAVPAMSTLFAATSSGGVASVGVEMAAAGRSVLFATVVGLALAVVAARAGSAIPGLGSESPRSNRGVLGAIGGVIALAAIAFVAAVGNPVEWAGDRLDEFRSLETPTFEDSSTRFGLSAGTGRLDFWTIAVQQLGDDPLKGTGGGGFQYAYTRDRSVYKDARDAHSVELEVGSELGLVGLALLVLALGAAFVGAWRSRIEGWDAAAVSAAALAIAAYWLVHASVDWLWSYPVVTGAMFATLGGVGAAQLRRSVGRLGSRARPLALAGLAVIALLAVPPFLSERYIDRAAELRAADPETAAEALERAHELNPLDDLPLLIAGEVARQSGDPATARARFEQAIDVRPQEWAGHYYLAVLDSASDPARAESELDQARALNPLEPCLANLRTAVRCSSGRA